MFIGRGDSKIHREVKLIGRRGGVSVRVYYNLIS